MREIIFRGKKLNGEWVYGFFTYIRASNKDTANIFYTKKRIGNTVITETIRAIYWT